MYKVTPPPPPSHYYSFTEQQLTIGLIVCLDLTYQKKDCVFRSLVKHRISFNDLAILQITLMEFELILFLHVPFTGSLLCNRHPQNCLHI